MRERERREIERDKEIESETLFERKGGDREKGGRDV
jgi:hypothetical protein